VINRFVLRGAPRGGPTRGGRAKRWLAAAALAVALPALAFGLYAGRSEWLPAVHAGVERVLHREPTDPRSLIFHARLDMEGQRYEQAAAGYGKALSGRSKAAKDPGVWVEYAEARGMAQGRILAGEPARLVERALQIDGNYPQALDLAGSAAWEAQEFGKAAAYWTRLLAQIPPETSRHEQLSLAIQRAQQRAKLSLPPAAASQLTTANAGLVAVGERPLSAGFAAALQRTGSAPVARR
jgi:tetratricopeptide (TPR) repeat protein